MTCPECERLIYLYTELDQKERMEMDAHLATCSSCTNLFVQVQQEKNILRGSLKNVPAKFQNENPFLTAKIISAIQTQKSIGVEFVIERFLPVLRFSFLRYSMAVVSIGLVVFFAVESNPEVSVKNAVSYYRKLPITKTVRLNSTAFGQQLKNSMQNRKDSKLRFLWSECLRACRADEDRKICEECQTALNEIKNEGI